MFCFTSGPLRVQQTGENVYEITVPCQEGTTRYTVGWIYGLDFSAVETRPWEIEGVCPFDFFNFVYKVLKFIKE